MEKQLSSTDPVEIENVSTSKRRLNLKFSRFSQVSDTSEETDWVLWESVKSGNERRVLEYLDNYSIKILLLELSSVLETYDEHTNFASYDTSKALARLSGISLLAAELSPKAILTVTPFHMAIMEKQSAIVKIFLEKLIAEMKDGGICSLVEVLKKPVVLNIPGDLNQYSKDDIALDGMNVFHLSARYSVPSLKVIFKYLSMNRLLDNTSIKELLEAKDKHLQQTPLHIAAKHWSSEATREFIKHGVNVNSMDHRGYTPLHIASKSGHVEDAKLLLSNGADANSKDNCMKTPLHKASNENMVHLLLRYNADRFAKYKDKVVANGLPAQLHSVFEKLVSKKSTACKALMDSFIYTNGQPLDSSGLLVIYDLGLFQHESKMTEGDDNEMAAHSRLLQSADKEALKHPLSEVMLHLKKKRVFKYFLANAIFYLIFLLSLSALAFLQTMFLKDFDQEEARIKGVRNTTHYLCTYEIDWFNHSKICHFWYDSRLREKTFGDRSLSCGMIFLNHWNPSTGAGVCDDANHKKVFSFYFFYFFTSFSGLILSLVEWMKLFYSSKNYFRSRRYIIELLVLLSTIGYLLGIFLFPRSVNLHLGAWSVFMAWINMTILLGHFPGVGVYLFMFTYVTKAIVSFLLVYLPLLIAFGFGFYLLLPHHDSFNDPVTAILKVFAMMIGELEYAENFTIDESKEPSDWSIGSLQIMFMLCLVLVSIIIHNLILGLTISETEKLFKKAKSYQLEHLVKQLLNIEEFVIFKPSIYGNQFRSLGKCLSLFRIGTLGTKISEGGKIFPYLEELKHGKGKMAGFKKERSWKLCVKPYKWKTVTNDNIIRPWLNLNMEGSLEDCDLYFYDDVNGTLGKETGYQLPHAVVKDTIKLLERQKRDRKNEYQEHDSDDICDYIDIASNKGRSIMKNNFQTNASKPSKGRSNRRKLTNFYKLVKEHIDKVDEILESRPILEELLDSLKKEEMDQLQSEA